MKPAPPPKSSLAASLALGAELARLTDARVALGRSGASLPTRAHLAFLHDHALARDAVWTAVDFERLGARMQALALEPLRLRSRARDRAEYLRRPDLGRSLDDDSAALVAAAAEAGRAAVALVVADGLSAAAIEENALAVVEALAPSLARAGTPLRQVALVEQGRVAIGDPIGEALGADVAVVLVGERPGLSAADSLGCYLTWAPRPGTPDSRRVCISNIRRGGLAPSDAAQRIAAAVAAAFERRATGVAAAQPETE